MLSYYGVDAAEKREALLRGKSSKPFIDEIICKADEALMCESVSFKMSEYLLFHQTGSRWEFERPYFLRRRMCNYLMMAYWLTNDEKYYIPLIDYIGYICDEFTWCLPAHSGYPERTSKGAIEYVDLFQAETARFFGEIIMCVGDRLPAFIKERMKYEIERRIFSSIDRGYVYSWESCRMNWATVCGAGCVMAAMYFGDDDKKEKYAKRFALCLDSYLEGINDDGCCQEGLSYWGYGFGHFIILSQLIKMHTGGKVDYFKNPKVKEIALFLQKVRMSNSKVASFSDGGENMTFKIGMVSFLKSVYPDVVLPDISYGVLRGNVDSVSELLWFDENYVGEKITCDTSFFQNTQWYIKRQEHYSFAAKGGNNDEPHNHNDIGSFMITAGDEVFISDLGCGEYVKETFLPETRYSFVQNCSRGHSVPIIDGAYQMPGAQFCAKNVSGDDSFFMLDISPAYSTDKVKSINRRFDFTNNGVHLMDEFLYTNETCSVCERFISKIEPQIKDGGIVDFGCGVIKYNENKYNVSISTDSYVSHHGKNNISVYFIDFVSSGGKLHNFECDFEIKSQN